MLYNNIIMRNFTIVSLFLGILFAISACVGFETEDRVLVTALSYFIALSVMNVILTTKTDFHKVNRAIALTNVILIGLFLISASVGFASSRNFITTLIFFIMSIAPLIILYNNKGRIV